MKAKARKLQPWQSSSIIIGCAVLALAGIISFASKPLGSKPSGKYTLAFAEGFKPALASRDDLGISVVLAVDVSGSMGDSPASGGAAKYKQASVALGQVVDVIERLVASDSVDLPIKLGIIKFNNEPYGLLPLTVMDKGSLASLRTLVSNSENFSPGGSTSLGLAVERGTEMLAQSGTILRSLIVVSDGVNTSGPIPEAVLEAVYANRNSFGTKDYPVSTNSTLISFIGFDLGSGSFDKFAGYGVRVTAAADRQQLATVLSDLLEADITRLEASSLGGD